MTIKLDLDDFQDRLTELKSLTDDFGVSQTRLQTAFDESWTSLAELNQFDGPHGVVLVDLATAFNAIRASFEGLALDLRTTFENFVRTDADGSEKFDSITADLDGIDTSLSTGGSLSTPAWALAATSTMSSFWRVF